jgi:hypothetical protein
MTRGSGVLFLVAWLGACGQQPPAKIHVKRVPQESQAPTTALKAENKSAAKPQPGVPKAPAESLTDADLERAIRDRFARSKIGTNNFQVRVRGGVAVIEGFTAILQHKGTATRLAKAAGAKRVENRIEIDEAARQEAAERLRSSRRRSQSKRSQPRSEQKPSS